MIAYIQVLNRTEPIFDIGQRLSRKKLQRSILPQNQFLGKSLGIWKLAEMVTQLQIAVNLWDFWREFNPRVAMTAYP